MQTQTSEVFIWLRNNNNVFDSYRDSRCSFEKLLKDNSRDQPSDIHQATDMIRNISLKIAR
ncbi:hypothetical protein LguiA_015424 [Lonicera macranthoides]